MSIESEVQKLLDAAPESQNYREWFAHEQDIEKTIRALQSYNGRVKKSKLAAGQSEHGSLEYHLALMSRGGYSAEKATTRALSCVLRLGPGNDDYTLPAVEKMPELISVRFILDATFGFNASDPDVLKVTVTVNSPLYPHKQGWASSKMTVKKSGDELTAQLEKFLTKAVAKSATVFIDTLGSAG